MVDEEEEPGGRVTRMLNVKCALFQVMAAKYFSSRIPVIGKTKGGGWGGKVSEGGRREDWNYTDSNKRGASASALLSVVLPGESGAGHRCR